MTQIGEMVKPPEVDVDETNCPFDHANVDPPAVENDLIGVGGTLARRMKAGQPTGKYAPYKGAPSRVKNPKDVASHPFSSKNKGSDLPVRITDSQSGGVYHYPVSCAAHHLIPGQESLKQSPLLTYMVKKGDQEAIKGGNYADGMVWADLGYDVNGTENGVFLPGSYAVGGGRGGMGVWDSTDDGDDDEPDADDAAAAAGAAGSAPNVLSGSLNEISNGNRKWLYVKEAVRLAPGQFHDRHVDYSLFVQEVLEKIFENYNNLAMTKILGEECGECKKRQEKIMELGIPTPFGLATRLNGASSRLQGFLNGTTWRINIYTSKWGRAYMQAVLAGSADAG